MSEDKGPRPIGDLVESFAARHGIDLDELYKPRVAGIDPSLSNTAVVIGDGEAWKLKEFSSPSYGDNVGARMQRYDDFVTQIIDWMASEGPLSAIFIEDYAFSRNGAGQSRIIEFGAMLRWHLVDLGTVAEVKANTLKKFVAGKGNAPKNTMLAHVQKRWGELFDTDDAGDAFGLYKLGLVVEGIAEADTIAMREAAAKVEESIERNRWFNQDDGDDDG